jgi:hypothetical protein
MHLNSMDANTAGTITHQLLSNLHLQQREYMDKEYLAAWLLVPENTEMKIGVLWKQNPRLLGIRGC